MHLESDPGRRAAQSSRGENAAGRRGLNRNASVGAKLAARRNQGLGQPGIEHMAAQAERRGGQMLRAHRPVSLIPDDLVMP